MAKEGPHFVVGAEKNEDGRIVLVKEKGAQLQADAHFPQLGRMQLSDAQASMLPRIG